MKVLHIMSTPYGGAANAALRLHLGLLENNIESKVLTIGTRNDFPEIYSYANISRWGWLMNPVIKKNSKDYYFNSLETFKGKSFTPEKFTLTTSPYNIESHPLVKKADIINLHWVSEFINIPSFFNSVNKPIVWTLHDMNPFTGGCHYSFDCDQFIDSSCRNCPQTEGIEFNAKTLALDAFKSKQNIYKNKNINIVAPSLWLTRESQKSKLLGAFAHHQIPYGMPDNIFKPLKSEGFRKEFDLPLHKKLVLFVADSIDNYRKGIKFILEASKLLSADIHFVVVGKGTFDTENFTYLGEIKDQDKMALIYSAADLFVIPSLADNLPNTVLESLFCGTPVVGFNIGGIPDMVQDGVNGFLCNQISSVALAETIVKALRVNFDREQISEEVHDKYSMTKQAKSYIGIYQSLAF